MAKQLICGTTPLYDIDIIYIFTGRNNFAVDLILACHDDEAFTIDTPRLCIVPVVSICLCVSGVFGDTGCHDVKYDHHHY